MKNKILTAIVTMFMLLGNVSGVYAKDTVVTFDGEASSFMNISEGDVNFKGMMPGETRSINVVLNNTKGSKMNFYMSASILDNIAAKADQNAVYDFTIANNDQVFFESIIGGTTDNTVGQEYLTDDNNILLAELEDGESSKVTITLKLDGDSAENTYMNQEGQIKLVFTFGTPTENNGTNETVVQRVINYIKTGDNAPIVMLASLMVVSGVFIAIVLLKRKKEVKE